MIPHVLVGIGLAGAFGALAAKFGLSRLEAEERVFRDRPFPRDWEPYLEENVALYKFLPEELQAELKGYINLFVGTKKFEGAAGLVVTDEMRVTVAALACLLLLNRKTRNYPKLRTVILYPWAYKPDPDSDEVRLGESWNDGEVVLAWDHVTRTSLDVESGKNLVIHEFAHRLDQLDGSGDGVPDLQTKTQYATWASVMSPEFKRLKKKVERGHKTIIRPYGATNSAEFFACITETFFEKPHQLKKKHPQIYTELQDFYCLDPCTWREPSQKTYLGSPFKVE